MAQAGAQGLVRERDSGTTIDYETEIVARISAGDQHALAELYQQHQRPLYSYLSMLTQDDQLAEEVLQDTLLAVWSSAHRFRAQSTVRSWLFGIARRQAHNSLRRKRAPIVGESAFTHLQSNELRPDETALVNEGIDDLVMAIRQLPAALSETLMLTVVHNLSYEEVGKVLCIPIGTVKSRLNKARHVLRPLIYAPAEEQP